MTSRVQYTRTGIADMAKTAQEGEARRSATLKLSAEARQLRHLEIERQRKQEEEDGTDDSNYVRDHNAGGSQTSSSRYSSRQSSLEPSYTATATTNSSYGSDPRELRRLLLQLEERYKEVLVINAQLDCEKQFLSYSTDLLKDKLEDVTESNQYNQKCASDRKKELAYQRMQLSELNHQLETAQQQIQIRDELITERGLVLVNADGTQTLSDDNNVDGASPRSPQYPMVNGGSGSPVPTGSSSSGKGAVGNGTGLHSSSHTILSKANAMALKEIDGHDIDAKLASLLSERDKDKERIEVLRANLAEERERVDLFQKQDSSGRQTVQAARSQAQDYKFKLEQATQKISGLEGEIIRLEGQVKRYKTIAESAETQEEELKQGRRKIQRELRDALSMIEDLKLENTTLQRKVDKLARAAPTATGVNNSRFYRGASQAR